MTAQSAAGTGATATTTLSHRARTLLTRTLPPLVVAAGVLGIWLLVTYRVLTPNQRFLLPPPHEVVQEGFLTWRWLSEILAGLWSTTQVTLIGLALAVLIGMSLAVLMAQASWIERSVFPYAVVVQAMPIVAIVPVIGLWFSFDFKSRIVVTVIISVFPIITNTLFGLKSVDSGIHDLLTLHHAGRMTRLVKVQFPSAMPAIFTGLRISAGLAVIGAIVGDFFFRQGQPGLGRLLAIYQDRLRSEQLIVAIFFSALLGLALFTLFGAVGNKVTGSWHPSASEVLGAAPRRRRRLSRGVGRERRNRVAIAVDRALEESGAQEVGRTHAAATATSVRATGDEQAPTTVPGAPVPAESAQRLMGFAGPPLAFSALVLAGWYAFSYLVLQPQRRFLVPPPHEIVVNGFGDAAARAQLMEGLWNTSKVAITGLVVAIAVGVLFAILMSQAKWVERSFYPWAVVLQTIPVLALIPLIGLWFGFGFTSRVIVCVLVSLFPIITNTLFGLQSGDEGLHDLLSLYDTGRTVRFRKLEMRAALPAMFTGLRIAAGLSVIGAIVGEFFFQRGERGLGNLLDLYRGQLRTPEMFAALFLSSLLGIVVFALFTWMGKALTKTWHESAQELPV